jgi:hypothetical protein
MCPNNKWEVFETRDSIPKSLKRRLANYLKIDFDISNPNESYNSTDIIDKYVSTRKLIFIAKSNNNWRLAYIQGGFAKYNVLVKCKIENDSLIEMQLSETLLNIQNNDSVNELILKNKLKFKPVYYTAK